MNVGYLLAHRVATEGGVWVHCDRCKTWDEVNLAKIILERGPLLSLWNRSPKCRCGAKLSFHGHHAPGARVIVFRTDDPRQTDDIHRAWERERRRMLGMRED